MLCAGTLVKMPQTHTWNPTEALMDDCACLHTSKQTCQPPTPCTNAQTVTGWTHIHAERRTLSHTFPRHTDTCDGGRQVPRCVSSAHTCPEWQDLPYKHMHICWRAFGNSSGHPGQAHSGTHIHPHTCSYAHAHVDPHAHSQGPGAARGGDWFPGPTANQLPFGACRIAAEGTDPSAVSDSHQLAGWVPSRALTTW